MRVAIAGGHGKIALRLGRLLAGRGDEVVGLVRQRAHVRDLRGAGIDAVVLDLEDATVDAVAKELEGTDAVVFAAGAGPGSGIPRKDTVDRAAAVLLADAAERAGVRRYVQVSSVGVERVRQESAPDGVTEVFAAYLRAKLEAEDDLRARPGLEWTILRPVHLTDDPGTGQVELGTDVGAGKVSRDDVAAVLLALLDRPETAGLTLEVRAGDVPVAEAVAAVVTRVR